MSGNEDKMKKFGKIIEFVSIKTNNISVLCLNNNPLIDS